MAPVAVPAAVRPVEGAAGVEGIVVPGLVGVGEAVALPGAVVELVLPAEVLIVVPGVVLVGPVVGPVVLGTQGTVEPGEAGAGTPPVAPA